jgi:multidrug resistance efflux pump
VEVFVKRAAIFVSILAGIVLVVYLILINRQTAQSIEDLANAQAAPNLNSTATLEELPEVIKSADGVIAKCKLVPKQFVDLSFNTNGLINEVLVQEGDIVTEGQVLARLSNLEQIGASIAAAELDVLNAQQSLDELYMNAPVEAAEALKELADTPVEVTDAERQLEGLTKGEVSQADIDIAKANVAFAEKKKDDAWRVYEPYANKPEESLIRANLLTKYSEAQKEYDAAVRKLNQLEGTASEAKIAQAEADLALARVKYENAQRRYEILKNGPEPDQVALANAQLTNAEAQLASAQAALNDMELKAPFSGTIVSSDLVKGQYVAPGVPVVKVADFSDWQVETTNLTELNIVYLQEGNRALIVFDALPDLQLPGTLTRIQSLGENLQGDIVYKAVFNLDQIDDRLKWNMTCSADIRFATSE